ncbi:glycosyltransferase family 2 protein [Pleomorphomonas carboxyditropha]|uniref:Glycosyltransferase 2-like domain-containing protein n=1 Tax=Pleomorphomonas carboxyditropha TaxID=2023338 RepID=A0A2G9WNX2_9HYPH|nr:glycosyltransferase family 2 protein [Pleomorphomonas carboxyditropha]PIO96373.1 hypothetical protein CJ014_25635 [Pleomorphomonas carboxyditropha]
MSNLRNSQKTLSVGIVTRTKNRAVLLRRALESVRNQTFTSWQLIIVNDGGTKEPVDLLVQQMFNGDPRVRIVHHDTSRGMEAASNAGIALLNTDYAIIHDDDDSWAPEFLAVTTRVLSEKRKQYPSIRGIVSQLNAVYETVTANLIQIEDVRPWYAGEMDRLEEGFLSIQTILVRNQFPPIAFLFDLGVCKELGMFDANLPVLGDWDFHTRFVLKHDIWVHPEFLAFYHHRVTADGDMGNSVHTGNHLHALYRQMLRNKWIRDGVNDPTTSGRMGLMLAMEIQDSLAKTFNKRDTRRKYKSPIRQALSDGVKRIKKYFKGSGHVRH